MTTDVAGSVVPMLFLSAALAASALQTRAQSQHPQNNATPAAAGPVSRTVEVMDYRSLRGATPATAEIDFVGTALMAKALGQATVEAKGGSIQIKGEFENLEPPASFGSEYLTYVLWAVTPEGRPSNLGEVELAGSAGRVKGKVEWESFGLMVTAEPYCAVTSPSELVVLKNEASKRATGAADPFDAKSVELGQAQYPVGLDPAGGHAPVAEPGTPVVLSEARYALSIARSAGAARYAPDTLRVAQQLLELAEDQQAHKADKKTVEETAREAALIAEDARVLAIRRAGRRQRGGTR